MVFENLTKSLKGVTTTLTNTVSDGLDTITSPISSISKSITGANDTRTTMQEHSWHDQYKHWRCSEVKKLLESSCRSSLTKAKQDTAKDLLNRIIDEGNLDNWTARVADHTKLLQKTRKTIKDSSLHVIENSNKQKLLGKKVISLPQKNQTQRVVSFEEFVMNAQQRLREIENNTTKLQIPARSFSLEEQREIIHSYSKDITKKSFGIILDHGKFDAINHRVVKLLKKINSLQELKASSFEGEDKRYNKKITEAETQLQSLYSDQRTTSLTTLQEGYAYIAEKSEHIHTDWLLILAKKSEYQSLLTAHQKNKSKDAITECKVRTKKLKLLQKKQIGFIDKFDTVRNTLHSVSKKDVDSIESAWNKRKDEYDSLTNISYLNYLTLGATCIRQKHGIYGFSSYMITRNSTISKHIKSIIQIGKQVESEYSLTQNHLKKLIRDVRKLYADINAQQSTTPVAQKCIDDIQSIIKLGEDQITTLKKRKNEAAKQTAGCNKELTALKDAKKTLTFSSEKTIALIDMHIYALLEQVTKQMNTNFHTLTTTLHEIGSNKKLSLPKTKLHESVRKKMRILADSIQKQSGDIKNDEKRFNSQKNTASQIYDTHSKSSIKDLLQVKAHLI